MIYNFSYFAKNLTNELKYKSLTENNTRKLLNFEDVNVFYKKTA